MKLKHIDGGNEFDFGKTSKDYSKYRDIYPLSMYEKMHASGIGLKGQKILDLGTGTGVFPRGMYHHGADFVGVDISVEQINEAKRLSAEKNMKISFEACPAENISFADGFFDAITAVQCFLYFDKEIVLPKINSLLNADGLFATVWMTWLPGISAIASETEDLILKYNPSWKGFGYQQQKSEVPDWSVNYFTVKKIENYLEDIPFTVESWMGRIRACRGVAAVLDSERVSAFDGEHKRMLLKHDQEEFTIPHQILIHVYGKK